MFSLNNKSKIKKVFQKFLPDYVINCAAMTSLDDCEKHPNRAIQINSNLVIYLNKLCTNFKSKLIQISTDHYYLTKGKKKESHEVKLLNVYAKSKYLAELNTLTGQNENLVIRTNFIGFYKRNNKFGFSEWLFRNLQRNKKIYLFSDYFHSPIHVRVLTKIICRLISKNAKGIFNVASKDTVSKSDFCKKIFKKLKMNPDCQLKSVFDLKTCRANENGLDVSKTEKFLSLKMPYSTDTAKSIVNDFIKIKKKI